MKNLNLENYGIQEMNAEEMRVNNGGLIAELAIGIAAGLVISFCDNFGDFVSGYKLQPLQK
ncbi:MAG: hypothetical protein PHH37_02395 [Paludibacter sp.]|nr:hypothetical protein [Paludibacter sp.]